ncbi:signal peptide peptidase SppA, partial [Candidatus Poribacteria bacterium]|nr:signal peptide peptidase SppA [Candidatus Poribacteria bacterium]
MGRTYDIGFALRPGTWRTTLSVDMRKLQDVSGLDFSYGVEIRPIREIMLRGTYNSDKSYDIRFGINLGNFGIGSVNYFDENSTSDTGVGYFHFTTAAITKPISRKRVFLDLEMSQLERTLRIAKSDKDVAGVLIRLKGIKFGMGRLQEIRDAIIDFRKSGRIVACYITYCSTGDYIVASACDAIYMHPSADVRLVGLKFEISFYRDVLDKLGIQADLDHFGEYKSASEAFTRKDMSEKHRENMNALLDDLYDQLTTDIATARGWTPETVKEKIDTGPFTANQAIKSKIVDRLLYEDQLENAIKRLVKRDVRHLRLYEYLSSSLYPQDWSVPNPKIAVIEAKGMMLTGESFYDLLTGSSVMGASTISRAIDHCRTDDSIKAVVLRIDSVGGLVVAADIIWHKLMRLTAKKPLIVSMGDVAASGGYYIAVPAETIVAEPGTITGSIGVIGGKHSLKELYEKIGIKKEIMTRGKNADFFSNFSDFTPEQKENLRIQLKEVYDDFITKVAQGRENLTVPEVDEIARGRIWTGRQAKKIGLVDELGG